MKTLLSVLLGTLGLALHSVTASEPTVTIRLWPGPAPGEVGGDIGPEADTTKPDGGLVAGRRLIRLGNVAEPTIAIHPAPADKNTGAAVLVCPGGGYHILAMDLEGTEVCDWLNSIGVTGIVLKYRVPRRKDREMHDAPLQDAQRAMGILRQRAAEFGIDPKRIGVLGFSAGGHLSAMLSNHWRERTYPVIDAADARSCRPDFFILIYPAYLTENNEGQVIAANLPLNPDTPPAFLVMAADDPVKAGNVLHYALALQQLKVPVELHLYPSGGHGYGLRRTDNPVTWWPDHATQWLRHQGWLKQD